MAVVFVIFEDPGSFQVFQAEPFATVLGFRGFLVT